MFRTFCVVPPQQISPEIFLEIPVDTVNVVGAVLRVVVLDEESGTLDAVVVSFAW
jgi:hypothetical protein